MKTISIVHRHYYKSLIVLFTLGLFENIQTLASEATATNTNLISYNKLLDRVSKGELRLDIIENNPGQDIYSNYYLDINVNIDPRNSWGHVSSIAKNDDHIFSIPGSLITERIRAYNNELLMDSRSNEFGQATSTSINLVLRKINKTPLGTKEMLTIFNVLTGNTSKSPKVYDYITLDLSDLLEMTKYNQTVLILEVPQKNVLLKVNAQWVDSQGHAESESDRTRGVIWTRAVPTPLWQH